MLILPIRVVVARHVRRVYRRLGRSKMATARALNIHVRTVYRYLKAAGEPMKAPPAKSRRMIAAADARRNKVPIDPTWSGYV